MPRALALAVLMLFVPAPRAFAVPAPVSPHDTVKVAPAARDTLEGIWRVDDADPAPIVIRRAPGGYTLTRTGLWTGAGQLVEHRYEGTFESQRTTGDTMRVSGLHHGRFRADGRLDVTVVYTRGRHGTRREVWKRVEPIAVPEQPVSDRARPRGSAPETGGIAMPDSLPRMIGPPRCDLPEGPEHASWSDTLVVEALVGADGRVHETRVTHGRSLLLHEWAEDCARGVRFRPAMLHGRPVECWVAIPIVASFH